MTSKKKNEYIVPFKGAKLSKSEANKAGFGILTGFIGIIIALVLFGTSHKFYSIILVGIFAGVGFLGFGYLRKRKSTKKT